MKKIVFSLFLGVLFLAGCTAKAKEPVSVDLHYVSSAAMKEKKQITEREISIIDPRDNKVVEVFHPGDYESKEEMRAKAAEFARELAKTIDRPMKPVKLTSEGKLHSGQSRMILKEAELVERILNDSVFNTKVMLPIVEEIPNVTEETIAGIDESIIGSYTTYFDATVEGRSFNIEKSSKEIHDIILGPGDRFSFNTVVGNASKANGYALATVIVNQEFVPGYGGGVCQTSSTLYNAVAEAGLEIVELHHHSKHVGYVPIGKDATIVYPYKDFKFINSHPYPIIIKSIIDHQAGTLEVQIRAAEYYVSNH